jgi:uridine kinase
MKEAIIIGIGGGSGSGKTTIVNKITQYIPDFVFIAQDNYYKSADYLNNRNITAFNFDHPDAFDNELILSDLKALKQFSTVEIPQYDFVHHRRKEETVTIRPQKLIIFEGIMIFWDERVRDIIDLKIYVDTPDDIRFIRRLKRDMTERGRTLDSVIAQYYEYVRPGHYQFIEPTKKYADLIIPEGGYNTKALDVLVSFLRRIVEQE